MEGLAGFLISLALVIAWSRYRGRGKRAAKAKDKELTDQLVKLGVKFED